MSTATAVPTATDEEHEERSWDLHERVVRDMIEREDAYADMPQGATLMLVPDDDPAHAAWVIERGIKALKRGSNVYFRHVRVADLPEPYPPADPAKTVGMRRTQFNWDGTVHEVAIKGPGGEWHAYEPSAEERVELEKDPRQHR